MENITELIAKINEKREEVERLSHLQKVVNYDMETSAPLAGLTEDTNDVEYLSKLIFNKIKDEEYIALIKELYARREELDIWDKRAILLEERDRKREEEVDKELNDKRASIYSSSYNLWLQAKEKNDYNAFKNTLQSIYELEREICEKRDAAKNPYDIVLNDYEEGFTTEKLDPFFAQIEERIVPLYKRVKSSYYKPRTDFLKRRVPIYKQEEFTNYLLKHNGFDFKKGSVSTTMHPFTEQMAKDDVRVTTHYHEDNFISNMYSVIHEGGHALFGQNIPDEVFTHHLGEGSLTMGKHESVSRLYENVIGRSLEYIESIYPEFNRIFKEEMYDITPIELYEGVNFVDVNNCIRTEADELTYSLHILVRYKLEKLIMEGKADFSTLNLLWNKLYKEYLDVEVKDDNEGILQDVHWTSGFGYFPTYAIGNALNCIYVAKMEKIIDVKELIAKGKMNTILDYLRENVFKSAPLYDTDEWIEKIAGEKFSAERYCSYLEEKYTRIYKL